jgi:hypothetical protein
MLRSAFFERFIALFPDYLPKNPSIADKIGPMAGKWTLSLDPA